jgi:hypothetical protein
MGKFKMLNAFVRTGGLVLFCIFSLNVFGQNAEKQDSITVKPVVIYQIIKPSCMPCHSNEGRDKPRNKVNFSVWENYTSTEKMMLAGSIQHEIQKGDMPPKGFLSSHPANALNAEQISQIVQWCDSLKLKQ